MGTPDQARCGRLPVTCPRRACRDRHRAQDGRQILIGCTGPSSLRGMDRDRDCGCCNGSHALHCGAPTEFVSRPPEWPNALPPPMEWASRDGSACFHRGSTFRVFTRQFADAESGDPLRVAMVGAVNAIRVSCGSSVPLNRSPSGSSFMSSATARGSASCANGRRGSALNIPTCASSCTELWLTAALPKSFATVMSSPCIHEPKRRRAR